MRHLQIRDVLCLLLVLSATSSCATSVHNRHLRQWGSYSSIVDGYRSETLFVRRLSNGQYKGNISLRLWMARPDFKDVYKIITSSKARATVFLPTDESWNTSAGYWCLTEEQAMDSLSAVPEYMIMYIKALLIPNETVTSDQFKEGMKLRSMHYDNMLGDYLTYTLGRKEINGTMHWVLKGASYVKVPGTNQYDDVIINPSRTDIKAGQAMLHQVFTMTRVPQLEDFWANQKKVKIGTDLPIGICPNPPAPKQDGSNQPRMTGGEIAGIIIGVVFGLLFLATLVLALVLWPRMRSRGVEGALFGVHRSGNPCCGGGASGRQVDASRQPRDGGGGDGGDSQAGGDQSSDRMASTPFVSAVQQSSSSSRGSTPMSVPGGLAYAGSCATVASLTRGSPTQQQPVTQQQLAVMQPSLSPFAVFPCDSIGSETAVSDVVAPSGRSQSTTGAGASASHSSRGSQTPSHRGGSSSSSSGRQSYGSGTDGLGPLHDGRQGAAPPPAGMSPAPVSSPGGGQHVPADLVQQISWEELDLHEEIGRGAEGKVFRGTWRYTTVAVKQYLCRERDTHRDGAALLRDPPNREAMEAQAQAAFDEEVHWLHNLKHPNLVQFYAVCLNPPLVVMEFYKDGSVYALIQKAGYELQSASRATTSSTAATPTLAETSLTWDRRLEMLHDVAAGMSYLHGRNHVHGDLRSPNLLIGGDRKVKIGDFGFTKQLDCQTASITTKRISHPRWMAPELMKDSEQSLASDVYSFGMIMYELLTFTIPFDGLRKQQVPAFAIHGRRPDIPQQIPAGPSNEDCLHEYKHLMQDCWAQDAAQRPTIEEVVSRLTAIRRASATGRSARSMPNMRAGSLRPGASIPSQRAGSAPPGVAAAGGMLQGGANTSASSLASLQGPPGQAGVLMAAAAQRPEAATASQQWSVIERQLPVPLPRHRVSSIPEAESLCGDELPCSLAALEDAADSAAAGPMSEPSSLPVSSAVVAEAGERRVAVAAVGLLGSWQQADDELVSLASAGLEAERVLLVGSDLPSTYGSRQT